MGRTPQSVKNSQQIGKRFSRAAQSYNEAAEVQRIIAHKLATLLPLGNQYRHAFELGTGSGILTSLIDQRVAIDRWTLNDLSEELLAQVPPLRDSHPKQIVADVETLKLAPLEIDLLVSSSALQWLTAPIAFIENAITNSLSGATILIATFGTKNLKQIRALTGKGLAYPTEEEYATVIKKHNPAYFQIFSEEIDLEFPSTKEVLRHLQRTGTTALPESDSFINSPSALSHFIEEYTNKFATDHQTVKLTYHPIYMHIIKE